MLQQPFANRVEARFAQCHSLASVSELSSIALSLNPPCLCQVSLRSKAIIGLFPLRRRCLTS